MKRRIFACITALCLLIGSASALTVEQTREILREHYVDEIPEEVLAHDTIDEILLALGDPYTEYYTAEELADFYASVEDIRLVGIGIRAYYLDQGVEILQVAAGGPAAEGGLRAGDWIIAIDGQDTRGADEADVDVWIRGEEGTQVELTVLRGQEIFSVVLTRRPVVFPTAQLEKIEDGIGWIVCSSFGSNTFEQFYNILTAYDSQVDGWVVDLRGNSGGNAWSAVLSAGCFGGWNSGVYMRDGRDTYYGYFSLPATAALFGGENIDPDVLGENGYLTEKTVCVLTDQSTASAAELFCTVVRDSGAGVIIGARTYGKGVAQTLFTESSAGMEDFFPDGDGLKVTTDRWFSMVGTTCDQVGVLPHVLVDGKLADEVTALLMAPYTQGEYALILRDVCTTSTIVQHFVIPMERLSAPENAPATRQLLAALKPGVTCQLSKEGEVWNVSVQEAASACGVTVERTSFSDTDDSLYADDIEAAALYGVVHGDGNGTFRPKEALTRAEMCALAVKALRCPIYITSHSAFSDVDSESWYAPYINSAYRLGLVDGVGNGLFEPEDEITHEEFLVMLGKVAQKLSMKYYEVMKHDGAYGDLLPTEQELEERYAAFRPWARESIWLCDGEYAWTDIGQIVPEAATTREEAASSMYRLLCRVGLLSE